MWVRVYNSFVLFLYILNFSTTHGFAQATTVRFVDEQGETLADVDIKRHEDIVYLPIDSLKSVFDSNLTQEYHRPRGKLTLKMKGSEIGLRIRNSSVTINSGKEVFTLSDPPRVIQGQPMLPIAFYTELLPKLYEVEVKYNANLQRVRIMPKAAWELPTTDTTQEWTIIIDPGHGGEDDVGCQSQNGLIEKDIVLAIAKNIQKIGSPDGLSILLTRNEDVTTKHPQRVQFSNQNRGQLLISLHCNASYSTAHKGIKIFLNNPYGFLRFRQRPITLIGRESLNILKQDDFLKQSKDFARILEKEMNFLVENPIEIIELPLISISDIYMPAVQIELGYLSNIDDVTRLSKPEHITELTKSIVRSIQIYSASHKKSSEPNGIPSEEPTESN